MAGKKKNGAVDDQGTDTGLEADDDVNENPLANEADDDDAEEFVFDAALLPQGVKLVDLAPDFVRPDGFLMLPRINKKTGEISPMTATFAGILHDVVPWTDNRGKQRVWFACEAGADIPGGFYTGVDENEKEFTKPITKGTRIGISGSGAINALKAKKGHYILLHWTGRKVAVKNGDMWEVKAKVSESPVVEQPKA